MIRLHVAQIGPLNVLQMSRVPPVEKKHFMGLISDYALINKESGGGVPVCVPAVCCLLTRVPISLGAAAVISRCDTLGLLLCIDCFASCIRGAPWAGTAAGTFPVDAEAGSAYSSALVVQEGCHILC